MPHFKTSQFKLLIQRKLFKQVTTLLLLSIPTLSSVSAHWSDAFRALETQELLLETTAGRRLIEAVLGTSISPRLTVPEIVLTEFVGTLRQPEWEGSAELIATRIARAHHRLEAMPQTPTARVSIRERVAEEELNFSLQTRFRPLGYRLTVRGTSIVFTPTIAEELQGLLPELPPIVEARARLQTAQQNASFNRRLRSVITQMADAQTVHEALLPLAETQDLPQAVPRLFLLEGLQATLLRSDLAITHVETLYRILPTFPNLESGHFRSLNLLDQLLENMATANLRLQRSLLQGRRQLAAELVLQSRLLARYRGSRPFAQAYRLSHALEDVLSALENQQRRLEHLMR